MVICRNLDLPNRNEEIDLEKRYDSAKIGMVGISETVLLSIHNLCFGCKV